MPKKHQLIVFGSQLADIVFGCGGIIARETLDGTKAHLVICAYKASHWQKMPREVVKHAEKVSKMLGATIEFAELNNDTFPSAHIQNVIQLGKIILKMRPHKVLGPTQVNAQPPNCLRLAHLVRESVWHANYGDKDGLKVKPPHETAKLFFYAKSLAEEPSSPSPLLIIVGSPRVLSIWTKAMKAFDHRPHNNYFVDCELGRARAHGRVVHKVHAQPIFPEDPLFL